MTELIGSIVFVVVSVGFIMWLFKPPKDLLSYNPWEAEITSVRPSHHD